MKVLRLRWSSAALRTRTRPERIVSPFAVRSRSQATAAAPIDPSDDASLEPSSSQTLSEEVLTQLPSPPVSAARTSAKLSALHARLSLPSRLPLETLARTLVDPSADPAPKFNNKAFSILGNDLLGYYTSEYITCHYPRLPLAVVFAAMYAYVGPKALRSITREWGVENAAEPGGEVDPGLLQYQHVPPEPKPPKTQPEVIGTQPEEGSTRTRRSLNSRVVYDNEFGEVKARNDILDLTPTEGVTAETASAAFVRAVMGAVYLHAGRSAAKQFYCDHFMSRQLNMASLFQFKFPAKDLSRLCAREGFQAPVARIESETGRHSRHPVFVVGVYSGNDKLGEGVGSSLDEARTKAAIAALKGWYLYSPLDVRLPSETEEPNHKPWVPLMVDAGDIVA